jgi:hypothetical protein
MDRTNKGKKKHKIHTKGELLDFTKMNKKTPVYCQNVASLLMEYFKALPEPLLTFDLEPKFINIAKDEEMDDDKKIKEFQNLIQQLPLVNRQTAKMYFDHLRKVAENSEKNQMTAQNIIICVMGARSVTPVFTFFIKYFEEIFMGVVNKENKKKEDLNYTVTTLNGFDFATKEEEQEIPEVQQEGENEEEETLNLNQVKVILNQNFELTNSRKKIYTSFSEDIRHFGSEASVGGGASISNQSSGRGNLMQSINSPVIPVMTKRKTGSRSGNHSRSGSTDANLTENIDAFVDSPVDSDLGTSPHQKSQFLLRNKILDQMDTQLDNVEKIQGNDTAYEDLIQDIIARANNKFGGEI